MKIWIKEIRVGFFVSAQKASALIRSHLTTEKD